MKFYYRLLISGTKKFFLGAFFILFLKLFLFISDGSCQSSLKEFSNDILLNGNNQNIKRDYSFRMKKSPWKAVAFSAVIPGSGQIYNESYWKVPIIWGLGAYFGYELIQNNNKYLDYKEQYLNSQTTQNPEGDPNLQALRELYKDRRDNFIIYSVILYVTNLVDAYVDAELYDFNVSDKIKVGIIDNKKLVNFKYTF